MGWLSLFKIILSLASNIASIVREKQLMDAGEQRAISKSLLEIASRAGIDKQIESDTAKMSNQQILDDLSKNNELRS